MPAEGGRPRLLRHLDARGGPGGSRPGSSDTNRLHSDDQDGHGCVRRGCPNATFTDLMPVHYMRCETKKCSQQSFQTLLTENSTQRLESDMSHPLLG